MAGGVKINAVRAVASRVRILGGAYRDAGAWRAADKAVAAVNGGFFDPLHRPVGLLVSGGKIVSRLSRSHGGVFYTLDSTAHILSADQFADEDPDDVKEAVQCGPLLVENHQPNHLKQQYARRTGIGVQRNGRVVIAVADGAISLPAWAALWASSSGLDCVTALNLDGGPSTQLSMQSGQVALDIRGGWPVPDAVSVR